MKRRRQNKWKKLYSCVLAVCLIGTLVLSNQSFGVFAEKTEEEATTEQTTEQEKTTVESTEEKGTTEIEKTTETASKNKTTPTKKSVEKTIAKQSLDNDQENTSSDIEFDLAKGNISFTSENYSGFNSNGNKITGTHKDDNRYVIKQSNATNQATSYTIHVGEEDNSVTKQFNIYLDGINIEIKNQKDCPIYVNSGEGGAVYLILKDGTNNVSEINYSNGMNRHAAIEKEINTSGLLCITCEEGYKKYLANSKEGHNCSTNENCGKLEAYANKAKTKDNNGAYNCGAGIGSRGAINGGSINEENGKITVNSWLNNLTIAGGVITAEGAAGDQNSSGGGAGIGVGSCINAQDTSAGIQELNITGGYINAVAGDDSASCVGGGYRSNSVKTAIYGGTINAVERVNSGNKIRGTGIGAGGGGTQSGSPSIAEVKIYGGTITAKSQYGAAIGGAGAGDGSGNYTDVKVGSQPAQVYIYDGYINAESIGNGAAIGTGGPIGSTTKGQAGDATVSVFGGTVRAKSEAGADIGGGGVESKESQSNGGKAQISISGGSINTSKGGIGGGKALAGQGGNATVEISGGNVTTTDIGGGDSSSNNGGNASVIVKNGTLSVGGVIGGGTSDSGKGGDASINVSGGTLDCASIGGGNSNLGTPGSVTSSDQKAGVIVTGGTLKAGTIGGGTNDNGDIGFATANISGGNIQGQFILSNTDPNKQCKFTMTGGTIDNTNLGTDKYQKAQKNGGAVYLSDPKGEVSISGGTIENSKAELGGAVYMTTGSFTLSGDATIQDCKATGNDSTSAQGGAVYLDDGTVTMKGGCILSSSAKQGGAVYLNKGTVTLSNGTIGKDNSPNSATEGAGVYIAGGTLSLDGGSIMYNTADKGAGAYLKDGSMKISNGQILHNTSKEDGGGAYLAGGTLDISSGIITENVATQNGGGIYLNNGDMTLSGGRIYSNKSVNGAGAYLHGGNLTVSGGGDFDSNIASKDGGGAYLAGGALTVNSGTFNKNTATQNGGGAYLAGGTLRINGGAFDHNTATNGAGAYAADGKVCMFGGNITNNKAQKNGGGFYVSSNEKPADVLIRSGKLTNNTAGNSTTDDQGNGGAIAVISSNNSKNEDHVIIGLRHEHINLNQSTREFTPFDYNDDKDEKNHKHESCPEFTGNQASGNGGGIYMNSTKSILDIYCLIEVKNTAIKDTTGGSIMSEGGTVNIGDIGNDGNGNNTAHAVGNIYIQSPMLVKGGDVKIYGNTDNPKFADKILVNIQEHAGSFNDYRYTNTAEGESRNYKIEYFENFQGSGTYIAEQYTKNDKITAIGNMYKHEGYKIVGWNTKENGSETVGKMYNTGDLIGSENDHTAWDGKDDTEALKLYAIWEKISYTVQYEPNADHYSGQMSSETFRYGEQQVLTKNNYKVTGKRFVKWNTEKDGSGTDYNETYDESKMINSDGATVHLYAQWANCTHKNGDNPGKLSYTRDNTNHIITETCDCGGHTATIQISGADVYYDGNEHPASLNRTGDFLESNNTITYAYKKNLGDSYGEESTTQPRDVGYYRAILTVQGQKISIEYQIKSPADAAQIDVAAIAGQHFIDFNGDQNCTVAKDDAFTVQYNVQGLNKGTNNEQKAYDKAPVLTLTKALPTGTTIIMQTEKSYWYLNNPTGKEIQLSSFKKMGTQNEPFSYDTSNIQDAQKYRFIIDFSDVKEDSYLSDHQLQIGLKYEYTGSEQGDSTVSNDKEQNAIISIGDASKFAVTTLLENNTGKITAPSDTTNTKWERKNLVWKITTTDPTIKLPSDAKLTLSTTVDSEVKTAIYTQNAKGEFIIPFAWTGSQDFTFALSSDQESVSNKSYDLTAALCIGSKQDPTQQLQVIAIEDGMEKASSNNLKLTIPVTTSPALKISGSQGRVLTKSDQLKVGIDYKNVEGCSIQAVIQKKKDGTYQGEYYKGSIGTTGSYNFTLGSTNGPGSYRLLVKVSAATGQTLLEVPYYFIVQEE